MLRAFFVLLAPLSLSLLVAAEPSSPSQSLTGNLSQRDVGPDSLTIQRRDSLETDEDALTDASNPPKYNDYAMSCADDRKITQWCAADPYKYYCDSKGKLQRQKGGKKDDLYCDWCDCIDLNPKPACILNLAGGLTCARDSELDMGIEGLDDFDLAIATKYNLTLEEAKEREEVVLRSQSALDLLFLSGSEG